MDEDPVVEAWRIISHLFMAQAGRFDGIAEGLGLAKSDLGALLHLDPGGTPSQRDLAERWACDASWVTAKVDRLEEMGYVARVPDPADRRRKCIVLTSAGRMVQADTLGRLYEPPAALRGLSATDRATLARVLRKVDGPELQGPPGGRPPAAVIARAARAEGARRARGG